MTSLQHPDPTTFDSAVVLAATVEENTVPRGMVHRAAVSEVFLTGAQRVAEGHFRCLAQLPRTHSYFSEHTHRDAHYDTLLLLEVFRQASIYVSHAFLDVSTSDKFIYLDSDTSIVEREALVVGARPASALIDVRVVGEYLRHGQRSGVTLDMTLSVNGRVAARHDGMSIRWMSDTAWNKIRTPALAASAAQHDPLAQSPAPLAPFQVGRHWLSNVVLGREIVVEDGHLVAALIVDQSNPAIFDHPLDHIPGMLLLEGFRQLALVGAKRQLGLAPDELLLGRARVAFTRFGEFGLATQVKANLDSLRVLDDGRAVVNLSVEQGGAQLAHAEVELQRLFQPLALAAAGGA
ncbi:ScbA/BarX family gamma-butyrolactone biosynthesis protein [Pseudomonas japonica]|uniref:A-factor biosynthesis hotdog domain-containing protein n=1 Tax=Pseudomonas japonica TaxID=256466 RepID=A0A239KEE9_9PSED|nr:ScbA/BarX family gamma-butyrolactone biosynthesis protein [Pseudomonas japonica]SNT16541.1 A-factor biosynthesis hotdog domain-containing protein [Pseudomonas japonica]